LEVRKREKNENKNEGRDKINRTTVHAKTIMKTKLFIIKQK